MFLEAYLHILLHGNCHNLTTVSYYISTSIEGKGSPVHFEGTDLEVNKIGGDADIRHCSCSSLGEKKRVWESSYTSLKSKKVKGGHQVDCPLDSRDFVSESDGRNDSYFDKSSSGISRNKSLVVATPRDHFTSKYFENTNEECQPVNIISEDHRNKELLSRGGNFRIMLMNIADDAKKSSLSKVCPVQYLIYCR